MKKLYTVILLLFAINAQAQDFGAIGSEWYYSYLSPQANSPDEASFVYLKSVADTVYAGKQARLINGVHFTDSLGNPVPFVVYQQGDTAFYYSHHRGKYISMYIFNRNAGDTIELDNPYLAQGFTDSTYKERIDSVTTEVINGIALKKYYTTNLGYGFWVEGGAFYDRIGSVNWFFPMGPVIATGYHGPLRCFTDGDINVNFTDRPCNATGVNSAEEEIGVQELVAYPNPFSNNITVKLPTEASSSFDITLYNLQGQKIYASESKSLNGADEIELTLPEMPAGLYLLHLSGQQKSYLLKVQRQ